MAGRDTKLKALRRFDLISGHLEIFTMNGVGRSSAPAADPAEIKRRNQEALAKRKEMLAQMKAEEATKPLPEGWRRCESRSRPGEFVYENIHTEERIAWFPTESANEEGKNYSC